MHAPPLAERHRGIAAGVSLGASTSVAGAGGGVGSSHAVRRRLYDQNLSDWSARVRKTKQNLDNLTRDCEQLRVDVAKQQQEVDERAETFRQLEERHTNEVLIKYNETKASFEAASQQKTALALQLSEYRKLKSQLSKERKLLQADFERKHAEQLRTAEVRDQLQGQIDQQQQQLAQLTGERRRMERELDTVQNNLRAQTDLADEVHSEIEHVVDGIKDSIDLTSASTRAEAGPSGP